MPGKHKHKECFNPVQLTFIHKASVRRQKQLKVWKTGHIFSSDFLIFKIFVLVYEV